MKHLRTKQTYLGEINVPNPTAGDIKLNVFPFLHDGKKQKLPFAFKQYEESFNKMLKHIPLQEGANEHYITIDSKFFTETDTLRREGVHIDGNFCADPHFGKSTWGGTTTTWGGTKVTPQLEIETKWVSEHGITPPIGIYVSDIFGGILTVSNEPGCVMWGGDFNGQVGDEGDFSEMKSQLTKDRERLLDKNELWLMSSNTPHESIPIEQGKRRTFMRITLNHRFRNEELFLA